MALDEIVLMDGLNHPSIIELLFCSIDNRSHWVIGMKLMENGSLRSYTEKKSNTVLGPNNGMVLFSGFGAK